MGAGVWAVGHSARKARRIVIRAFAILGALELTLGRMSTEDAALKKRFGAQWDQWASRVRYMVIPGVY